MLSKKRKQRLRIVGDHFTLHAQFHFVVKLLGDFYYII